MWRVAAMAAPTKLGFSAPILTSCFDPHLTIATTGGSTPDCRLFRRRYPEPDSFSGGGAFGSFGVRFREGKLRIGRRARTSLSALMLPENPLARDVLATAISGSVALSLLRFWEETARRGLFDQKLNRKLVHISIGLVFMLFWPLFSSGIQGAVLASLIPGVNIMRMLLLGLGIFKDEDTVKSMSRFGDYRELLKGPLYYASTITFVCVFYWRTSPIAIAAICNLCAGDGLADIVGRRFGSHKIPYNRSKSFAGSVAMAVAGFMSSIGYMHYFSLFGYMRESWEMVFAFLVVSLVTALIESLPISSELDDNLTVPVASVLLGSFVF
ncbi:probable phytol kinase 2, chloroplastic [Malania oleifera]|uniref:probable phytol kinase 2, chloroplastic n=1 Tax=Malania oleifera TaxID=397392 RepID=UPI0025AEB650|nr:probable phytol kinase 2, chloroplastic [Malania oleifera]